MYLALLAQSTHERISQRKDLFPLIYYVKIKLLMERGSGKFVFSF